MPTFTKPDSFYSIRRASPRTSFTVADMSGILADRIGSFLEYPAAYVGLATDSVIGLVGALTVYQDLQLLLNSSDSLWVLVSPGTAPIAANRQPSMTDIGFTLDNSVSPRAAAASQLLQFDGGMLPAVGASTITRTIMVAVSTGTRAGTNRVSDALYVWLSDMCDLLKNDFGCNGVTLSPVRAPAQQEKPMFSSFDCDIAVMNVTAVSLRRTMRSKSEPM